MLITTLTLIGAKIHVLSNFYRVKSETDKMLNLVMKK